MNRTWREFNYRDSSLRPLRPPSAAIHNLIIAPLTKSATFTPRPHLLLFPVHREIESRSSVHLPLSRFLHVSRSNCYTPSKCRYRQSVVASSFGLFVSREDLCSIITKSVIYIPDTPLPPFSSHKSKQSLPREGL